MNLEQTSASLTEQFGGVPDTERKVNWFFNSLGKVAFGGFGGISVAGFILLIYTIASKMIFTGDRMVTGILLSLFLIFAALSLVYVIWQESVKDKKSKFATVPQLETDRELSANVLADGSNFTPTPSVVEGTTELLDIKRKTSQLK
ncbi:MAG: hypothetical protein WBC19_09265 [Pyrinomonadaceae bacterium]